MDALRSESRRFQLRAFLTGKIEQKIPSFIQHTFRAKWQDCMFCQLLESFPPGTVVTIIDFAENYTFEGQDEIQSMHWHSDQITILVVITLRHKQQDIDGVESTQDNREILRDFTLETIRPMTRTSFSTAL